MKYKNKYTVKLQTCHKCWSGEIIKLYLYKEFVTDLGWNCYCGHQVMSERMYEAYLNEINLLVDDRYYLHQP